MKRALYLSMVTCLVAALSAAQGITSLALDATKGIALRDARLRERLPLFSAELNDTVFSSLALAAKDVGDSLVWNLPGRGLSGSVRIDRGFARAWKAVITFRNESTGKLALSGVVPLGESPERVYIKAAGPADYQHRLSRSQLFRPGAGAIGVVLPDNAWELGFGDARLTDSLSIAAIARRTASDSADVRRFRTVLHPGGSVAYTIYMDLHEGPYQEGLRLMFRDRWIYDLERFDNTLFERKDLEWIRRSYLLVLQFAWDHEYYDAREGRYGFDTFLRKYDSVIGRWDAYMIWPTWPRLGLDERDQWAMYRDLPGGVKELRRQAEVAHNAGTKYFISYNPWDVASKPEEHARGMEAMLRAVDGDGVVLDTWGESNKQFQDAADRVKPGIVLYSEGMAVPKDMPTLVAGRVHDAIYLPPPLNLNKLIKPEFAIFRVAQLAEGRIHRETAVAFFNGYGTEMNIMRPGRPDWIDEEFAYLARTTKILRDNSSAFTNRAWMPLIPSLADSIWVNEWPDRTKTIYTVLSLKPEGWKGPLFAARQEERVHYVSLWHHEEVKTIMHEGMAYVPAQLDAFNREWLDTRREGAIDCIARFPVLLDARIDCDTLRVSATQGKKIVVWAGMPSYSTKHLELPIGRHAISLIERLGRHEEKFVVQLIDEKNELMDERVLSVPLATPKLVSHIQRTRAYQSAPRGMVEIPSGRFTFKAVRSFLSPNEAVPYPGDSVSRELAMARMFMDRYPVTNREFQTFLRQSRYRPKDTTNFLRHWVKGAPPTGREDHPVVYVDITDANAYAAWAGKRLPTDTEWQYAAQGTDGRKYPWGNRYDSTRCNHHLGHTTPVSMFPEGRSPFGVEDMIGNVWQITNDVYDNGTFYFGMLRGGSYYNPTASWWYIPGGPQPADNPQILLMVAPGFDRSATVGFRCAADAVQ